MLVLGREEDGIFSVADLRDIAKFFAAPLTLSAHMGHDLMLQVKREKIALGILEWIGSLKLSSSA